VNPNPAIPKCHVDQKTFYNDYKTQLIVKPSPICLRTGQDLSVESYTLPSRPS
jgi:hypothetical protein